MTVVATAPDSDTAIAGPWASAGAAERRPVDDVVAAGVLLDVSRLLGGLLGLARPALGARTEHVTRLVRRMASWLHLDRSWEFEVAARLSQIGWLTVPAETHEAAWRGDPLPEDAWCEVASHPLVARDLLADVSRLDGVREMIARQREPYAVAGESVATSSRDRLEIGGQILRVCGDYVALLDRRHSHDAAISVMASQPLEYDPLLLDALDHLARDHSTADLTA